MLSENHVFPNPPIVEALLDIRVELPKEVTLAKLETYHEHVKERFPEKEPRFLYKADIKLSPEVSAVTSSGGPNGYIFRSPSEKKAVQARLDGFTFNKLKPYKNWEVFCSEARELWDLYFKISNPIKITRIALRYINRIEIPLPMKAFREYISTTLEIAPDLLQVTKPILVNFFMRLVILNPDLRATAIITQTIDENPTKNQVAPLIFDIDVFQEVTYTTNKPEMWDEFEKLRTFKNEIFFNSITEKAKELFK